MARTPVTVYDDDGGNGRVEMQWDPNTPNEMTSSGHYEDGSSLQLGGTTWEPLSEYGGTLESWGARGAPTTAYGGNDYIDRNWYMSNVANPSNRGDFVTRWASGMGPFSLMLGAVVGPQILGSDLFSGFSDFFSGGGSSFSEAEFGGGGGGESLFGTGAQEALHGASIPQFNESLFATPGGVSTTPGLSAPGAINFLEGGVPGANGVMSSTPSLLNTPAAAGAVGAMGLPVTSGFGAFNNPQMQLSEIAAPGGLPQGTGLSLNEGILGPFSQSGGFNLGSPAGTAASSGMWGDLKAMYQLASPAMSVLSGINGLTQAQKLKKLAELAAKRSDPFGASGGRGVADEQLQALLRDPSGAAANDPAYKLRIQAAQRAMAPMGQNSGAMAVAAAGASTDWYNQRLQQLGGLAGAGFNPGTGESLNLQGQMGASDLMSRSLASVGFGLNSAFGSGASAANSPDVLRFLQRLSQMGA